MKQLKFLAVAAAILLVAVSCQKEETEIQMTSNEAEQEIIAENLLIEIDALTDEAIELRTGGLKSVTLGEGYFVDNCPVVTHEKTSGLHKITLDYGTGCVGRDEKTRSGKIVITSTDFENLSVKREKTFDNFYVEGKKVEGKITKTITLNREDHSRVALVEENVTITFDDGTNLSRMGNLTREHLFGNLLVRLDDETLTWGEITTKHSSGVTITKTITETTPLLFKTVCRQIVSGIVTFTNGDSTWSIDYGSGECDNTATVTRNGESKVVKIRK